MPVNTELALKQWNRYLFIRDTGHLEFVRKADLCERFFRGDQWSEEDRQKLLRQKRPALTINKILSTISNVAGDQILNRLEIGFRPRAGAPSTVADTLTKLFKYISNDNKLDWVRSDVFLDGIITSRGFYDVRLDFSDNLTGDVRITRVNPKNVLIDPDADDYDPATWGDVIVTKWMTLDDIAVLYSEDDAKILKSRIGTMSSYSQDNDAFYRDRVGTRTTWYMNYAAGFDTNEVMRVVRVLDRQYYRMHNRNHFYDPQTGDLRPIPDDWDREKIVAVREKYGLEVIKRLVKRVRWTVSADDVVLHDDWSPYEYFTIVPYFPYFRNGKTVGLVENLIGPQELLNKASSQELHVINTSANSGWKVKTGVLRNMSIEELEQRGAETGLVIEADDITQIDKITPNQVPTGLDRVAFKAEEHIKTISGISDYLMGQAREDVSAKAVALNQNRASVSVAKIMDSLTRSDHLLAKRVLNLVQVYYTDPRIVNIVSNPFTGETETIEVNQVDEATGEIINDLTIGEYDVVVTTTPAKETLEDTQFEQALRLRELGISIPDSVLISSSRLLNKTEILQEMQKMAETPEAKLQAAMAQKAAELEVAKLRAEAAKMEADAKLRDVKAEMQLANFRQLEPIKQQMELEKRKLELEKKLIELEIQLSKGESND